MKQKRYGSPIGPQHADLLGVIIKQYRGKRTAPTRVNWDLAFAEHPDWFIALGKPAKHHVIKASLALKTTGTIPVSRMRAKIAGQALPPGAIMLPPKAPEPAPEPAPRARTLKVAFCPYCGGDLESLFLAAAAITLRNGV